MTTDDAKLWIDLLLDRAAELRVAGILKLSIAGLHAELAPAPPAYPSFSDDDQVADEPLPRDALDDPATYGRTEEEGVPGDDGPTRDPDAYEDDEDPPEDM